MRRPARGIPFDHEPASERIGLAEFRTHEFFGVVARSFKRAQETLLTAKRVSICSKSALSEQRREHAVARRKARVQRFGRGAEVFLYSACFGGRDSHPVPV